MNQYQTFALANMLDGLTIEQQVFMPGGLVPGFGIAPVLHVQVPVFPPQITSMPTLMHLDTRPIDAERPYRPPSLRHSSAAPAIAHASAATAQCTGCPSCVGGVCAAGTLIIDYFTGQLFLFRNVKDHTYGEPGGRYETYDKDIETTACRETAEETRIINLANTFLIGKPTIDVPCGRHIYRCYVVKLTGIRCSNYYKIETRYMPPQYQETDMMTRFSLSDIKKHYQITGNIRITSDSGIVVPASERLERVLKQGFNTGVL